MLLKSLYIISVTLYKSDVFENSSPLIQSEEIGWEKCLKFLFYGGYISYRKCYFYYILNSLSVTYLLRLKAQGLASSCFYKGLKS